MAEPRLISPMLDNFMMGSPISEHHGVCCCPAMKNETDERYIVKVISVPASQTQMDALLLSGAYPNEEAALAYYKELANGVLEEVDILEKLAELEGFIPYSDHQIVPMESGKGYEIYLLGSYKRSLQKHFKRHSFTHLDALNLGLDLCASLSLCRQNGYMFADLKPSNVFVSNQRLFRIGDLGFVRLDSLQFASLPEKYFSMYTPPEIRDAFSALNSTMDVYAAGLILYQTYNNGELPFNDAVQPGDAIPAPLYADYEMSEIILKACNPNPDERWKDPMEMGQAIISYMQRNGALDVPIVPIPTQEDTSSADDISAEDISEASQEDSVDNEAAEEQVDINDETTSERYTEETTIIEEISTETVAVTEDTPSESGEQSTDPELEEISILAEDDEDALEELIELNTDYDTITEEVSEILEQADELAALDVPEPVVVPEYIEVPMPEPEEVETVEGTSSEEYPEVIDDNVEAADSEDTLLEEVAEESYDAEETPAGSHHWLRNGIIALLALVVLVGGIFFYKNFYLLPIEFIAVEGNKDTLTVLVTTEIDESLLQVICSDTYGNQIPAPVINGKAEFTGLVPNTAYSIKVVAKGFHRLTGSASTAYSTPVQTNIVQFDAVAGSTEDSVILSFTTEGPSCDEWTVRYVAEGEEERTATFVDAQMVTITNLTVGKEYTFSLVPKNALYLTGQSELTFTPSKLIRAEKLTVTSCINNTLTVKWSAPKDSTVTNWSVRCHNDNYSQTVVTADTYATFEGLDHTNEFDIEVKAAGMSVSEKVTVPSNSITASNFTVDTSVPTRFTVTWEPSKPISHEGWLLRYGIVGLGNDETILCTENSAVINSLIPNTTYRIQLEDTKGVVLLGSQVELTTGEAVDFQHDFNGITITRQDLTFAMCKTPARPNWGRLDLSDSDYTTEFSVGTAASFLMRSSKEYYNSSDSITTMFVIRNQAGIPILISQQTKVWRDMWSSYNCKLEIPSLPTEVGNYSIDIYFNGELANIQEFTIK